MSACRTTDAAGNASGVSPLAVVAWLDLNGVASQERRLFAWRLVCAMDDQYAETRREQREEQRSAHGD